MRRTRSSCRDSSAAAVAALAFARQGLDALINQDLENDENPYVQAAHKRCQERFASVVVLPHAETALALDKISQRIAHGEVEGLPALRDQLSSQIGVTLYEAERANLFASVLQLVDRTGVGVLKRLRGDPLIVGVLDPLIVGVLDPLTVGVLYPLTVGMLKRLLGELLVGVLLVGGLLGSMFNTGLSDGVLELLIGVLYIL